MSIINSFDFFIDKNEVFKALDCNEESIVYDEMSISYNMLIDVIKKSVKPIAKFIFCKNTRKYDIDSIKDCEYLVYGLLSLGRSVDEQSKVYFDNNDYMTGILFNTMLDVLMSHYSKQVYEEIYKEAEEKQLGTTCVISPGGIDLPLETQRDIFNIINKENQLDIELTQQCMLNPMKSISFIIGADRSLELLKHNHECTRCTNKNCKMRKAPFDKKDYSEDVKLTIMYEGNTLIINTCKTKSISNILNENNISIYSPCAGNGTCGKCKVKILKGKVIKLQNNNILGEDALKDGWCLACSTFLNSDCTIVIPELNAAGEIINGYKMSHKVNSDYKIHTVNINKDELNEISLTEKINLQENSNLDFNLKSIRKLSNYLNDKTININLVLKGNKVIDIVENNDRDIYGIAIDIGTTTLVFTLVNLITGQAIDSYSMLNSQKRFGADVISRIKCSNEGSFEDLNKTIKEDLLEGIGYFCSIKKIKRERIYEVVIGANSTMAYLFLGLNPKPLAEAPFNIVSKAMTKEKFFDIFSNDMLDCNVEVFPSISAYVGGDILAGLMNCEFYNKDKISILIDIGTNGEMAIGNKDKIICLATAAGPAFEGANIQCGIGNIKGAINSVVFKNNKFEYSTIGDVSPEGICGSGVIDLTACCVKQSLIDENGTMDNDYIEVCKKDDNDTIIFTQKDIREIQLAKSAIRSGIEILIKSFKCSYEDIDKVLLAGGFGYHMNIENACTIGLIPQKLRDKVEVVGNTSLGGAVDYLIDKDASNKIKILLNNTINTDISSNAEFNDIFIDNMLFLNE